MRPRPGFVPSWFDGATATMKSRLPHFQGMAVPRRVVTVAAGAALALLGLALGAQLQDEGFLPPDAAVQNEINQQGAGGDPILLTGVLVAAGLALAAAPLAQPLLGRRLPRLRAGGERAGLLAALAASGYLLVNLVQTSFPVAVVLVSGGQRSGTFTNNLLAHDSPAVPSALLPVFGLLLAGVLAFLWALQRLAAAPDPAPWDDAPAPDPVRLLHRQLGLLLLSVPFLGLAAWGALRLLAGTPAGRAGDAFRVVLPLAALVLLGLLAAGATKAWQLVRYLREPRAAPLCEEAWTGAGRAEAWLAGALAALCLVAAFFKPLPQPLLQTGQTFGSDLPRHVQSLLLVLVPLLPAWRLQREGQRLFSGPPVRVAAPRPLVLAWPFAAAGLSFTLAGIATLLDAGPVAGWMLACAPAALAALGLRPIRPGVALLLVTAWATWCLGNSFAAAYDPSDAALIQFQGSLGVLALWRLLGAALAGLAAARLAQAAGQAQGARVAWPLAACTGLCLVAVALLELPLSIWAESSTHGQVVAIGSALASQEPAVQALMHGIALAAAVAAAVMVARLCRPGWFGRRGRRGVAVVAGRPIAGQ
ncbi:MAG: hypothetical protein QOI63_1699 [Thermoplasmata archaeon]|jgi:hypothetical protein|nr:hypothetical protein [Thermoplasmata archaeon]